MKKKTMSETSSASTSAPTQGTIKPSAANLPMQEISGEVLVEKYAKGDETSIDAVRLRVLGQLAVLDETLLAKVADKLGQSVADIVPATMPRTST